MHLFNLEKDKDLNTIIVGKPATRRNIFTSAPLTDDKFAAMMEVALVNDGPVTLLIDSKKVF